MDRITDARIRHYLEAIQPDRHPVLQQIWDEAVSNHVPIIKFEMESFLKVLLLSHKPAAILEIGTAVGYSASVMHMATGGRAKITTLELSEEMCSKARENFGIMGIKDDIELIPGDAVETVKTLTGTYDFIFLDAAKGQYLRMLEDLMRLLKPGGMLVSDNVLQDGTLAKSRFAVARRQRTIHQNMREYLWALNHSEQLATSILPVADGVAVSVKLSAAFL